MPKRGRNRVDRWRRYQQIYQYRFAVRMGDSDQGPEIKAKVLAGADLGELTDRIKSKYNWINIRKWPVDEEIWGFEGEILLQEKGL